MKAWISVEREEDENHDNGDVFDKEDASGKNSKQRQIVFIDEEAEVYLVNFFMQLEELVAKIQSVSSVIHEDREMFLIESQLSDSALEEAV